MLSSAAVGTPLRLAGEMVQFPLASLAKSQRRLRRLPLARRSGPAEGETPVPGEPATAGEPSPFNPSPTDSTCVAVPDFVVATPLNDTRGTGFSALDMLTIFNEQGPGTLTWLDGTTTTLGIQASAAGDTSEVDDPPRSEGYCVPVRQVPIQLRIESADGRLADAIEINPSFERFRGVLGSWVLAR